MARTFGNRRWAFAFAAAAAAFTITNTASAELIYGVAHTNGPNTVNKLFTFDSATPGTINDLGNISNLGNLQYLAGIDFRPSTGELYGLGYTGTVYKININTLVANSVGFVPGGGGSGFPGADIDFDPVTGRMRIIDPSTGANLSFNPDNGTHTLDSPTVQYAPGDPNLAPTPPFPRVAGIAYDNNVSGAASSTLFGFDIKGPVNPPPAILTTIAPLTGDMTTVGAGVSARATGGFDISGATGIGYAAFSTFQPTTTKFYTINLTNGQATLVGDVGIDVTQFDMSGLSVAPVVPPGGGGNNAPLPSALLMAPLGAMMAGVMAKRFRRQV